MKIEVGGGGGGVVVDLKIGEKISIECVLLNSSLK